jgi:hypothetical protein
MISIEVRNEMIGKTSNSVLGKEKKEVARQFTSSESISLHLPS